MNYNKTIIAGRVGNDIELRKTPNGTSVCEVNLAVNRKFKQGDDFKEETVWIQVTLWGRVAEVAHQYSGKGQPLFVEGRLQTDTWEDSETGKKRSKLKVVGENIQLLGSKGDQQPKRSTGPTMRQPETARQADPNLGNFGDDDDIPF